MPMILQSREQSPIQRPIDGRHQKSRISDQHGSCASDALFARLKSSAFCADTSAHKVAHYASMENASVANQLKTIREATGLSVEAMADRVGMPVGTYRHYEERIKKTYQPVDLIDRMIAATPDFPEFHQRLRELTGSQGLAEPHKAYSASVRGTKLLETLSGQNRTDQIAPTANDFKIGSDGEHVQVVATVDKAGLEKLIRRLTIMKEMLD